MTEPENFEEDLFADLYDDNDASKAAPPAKAPAPPVADANPVQSTTNDQPGISYEHEVAGDQAMDQDQDDDDDDDDVDFNLGGGMSNNVGHSAMHEDVPTPPPYGTVHKASAKEDG